MKAHSSDEAVTREALHRLFETVREAVLASPRGDAGVINPKGDAVKKFDLVADAAAIHFLETSFPPVLLLSEESGTRTIGDGPPRWRVVLDPVDGSDNWQRGLPLSAFSCALLDPQPTGLHPDMVEWALVGPLEQETPLVARRGGGAWRDDEELRVSGAERLSEAIVSCDLNFFAPPPELGSVMRSAAGTRALGSAAHSLALVASGVVDAHIDIRGLLTPESYIAGARLVLEAGGCLMAPDGGPVPSAPGLTSHVSFVASASRSLALEIVETLRVR